MSSDTTPAASGGPTPVGVGNGDGTPTPFKGFDSPRRS